MSVAVPEFIKTYAPSVMEVMLRKRNLKQITLAKHTDIDQAVISNILNGHKDPTEEQRETICRILRIRNTQDLLEPWDLSRDILGEYDAQ